MELFDHVKIKSNRITGIIVDILDDQFTVEADVERKVDDNSGYPSRWALYICTATELEPIK